MDVEDKRNRLETLRDALYSLNGCYEDREDEEDGDIRGYIEEVEEIIRKRMEEVQEEIDRRDEAESQLWIDNRYNGVL